MTWQSVVDAWVAELQATVPGLAEVTVHRYAPWSVESLQAVAGERHMAVWPELEAEITEPLVTIPSDKLVQTCNVLVWEDASEDTSRGRDDEQANLEWLELQEAMRARFQHGANLRLGNPKIESTRYQASRFDLTAGVRALAVRFEVRVPVIYT